jgi:hypothetical protein
VATETINQLCEPRESVFDPQRRDTVLGLEDEAGEDDEAAPRDAATTLSRTLTPDERELLVRFIRALETNRERDPKCEVVLECLRRRRWLELGCIIFSQYRNSIQWLGEQLTVEFPDEPIAVYTSPRASGLMLRGEWLPKPREERKELVRHGTVRLMLGTDAASEGLNLQRLATLINLDLPWNPTRLEQRKGRIQRIGQIHDTVQIYNLRCKDSVEDRVHQLLSHRLQAIYTLFGQLPDVLEDAWVAMALGEQERARKIIDVLPPVHPFEVRYTQVEKLDWEACRQVLDRAEQVRVLRQGW